MRIILTLLLLLSTHSVRADERMMPFIEWIVANTEYEYNGEPLPTIVQMPYAWLEVEVFGPENVAQAEADGRKLPEINGAYNPETNEMLFPDTVNPWSWDVADTLLHETVHFLQEVNGQTAECPGLNEREAYELHWQWAQEVGHPTDEPNWLFVYMLEMACTPQHFR